MRVIATAPPDPQLLRRLRAQIDVQAALAHAESGPDFIAADRGFHRLLYEAAGVPDLYELVRRHSGHVDRLRLLHLPSAGKLRAILADHRLIVDAIEARDPQAAQQAVRGHLSGTLSAIEAIQREHPGYLSE